MQALEAGTVFLLISRPDVPEVTRDALVMGAQTFWTDAALGPSEWLNMA